MVLPGRQRIHNGALGSSLNFGHRGCKPLEHVHLPPQNFNGDIFPLHLLNKNQKLLKLPGARVVLAPAVGFQVPMVDRREVLHQRPEFGVKVARKVVLMAPEWR